MAIIVNTNVQSLMVQNSLSTATTSMNKAMERMSTGLKINSAADDAAGMAVSTGLTSQIQGSSVAQSNAQMGASMLTTSEGTLGVIQKNLQRIRDLSEQAANGTYGKDARTAIKTEVDARMSEIDRISKTADFNGIKLLDGSVTAALNLQVGMNATTDDVIALDQSLFAKATCTALGFATTGSGTAMDTAASAQTFLTSVDTAISNITGRTTKIGAYQNRIGSAVEGLKVQETNLTSANSEIRDADIAKESSNFVRAQILQQSAASLLIQANQAPSIATSLV